MTFLALLLFMAASVSSPPLGVTGNWQTPDHSVVHVYPCGADICARLVRLTRSAPFTTDHNNPDPAKRNRNLCGLIIGQGFKPEGPDPHDPQRADDGHLYDPESGHTYSGLMQASGDELKLRGYIGISLLGRTEIWHRAPGDVTACAE